MARVAGRTGLDRSDFKILDSLELCGFGGDELRFGGFEDSVFAQFAAEMYPGILGDLGDGAQVAQEGKLSGRCDAYEIAIGLIHRSGGGRGEDDPCDDTDAGELSVPVVADQDGCGLEWAQQAEVRARYLDVHANPQGCAQRALDRGEIRAHDAK